MDSYWYLASPYTSPSRHVMLRRQSLVRQCLFDLYQRKILAYSPIIHFAEMALWYGLEPNDPYFYQHGEMMLRKAGGIMILMLDGWQSSVGVKAEFKLAMSLNLPAMYIRGEQNAVPQQEPDSPRG